MSDGRYRKARRGVAAMRQAELCGYGEAGRKYVATGSGKPHAVRVTDDWRELRQRVGKG